MIYLQPQIRSSLGDDTFWTWFERNFVCSYDPPSVIGPKDVVLQYSVLGAPKVSGGKSVGLMWEMYPELVKQEVPGDWAQFIPKIRECEAACDFNVVASNIAKEFHPGAYELPIGVDTDLFCPRDKAAMRQKYGYPLDLKIGFWCGTANPMKGMDRLFEYSKAHPEWQWIVIDKWTNTKPQRELAELMNCADVGLFTGRLRPYYMVEFEMMASDLPVIDISGLERDFMPRGRDKIFEMGWSRYQAKEAWYKFLTETVGAEVHFK